MHDEVPLYDPSLEEARDRRKNWIFCIFILKDTKSKTKGKRKNQKY